MWREVLGIGLCIRYTSLRILLFPSHKIEFCSAPALDGRSPALRRPGIDERVELAVPPLDLVLALVHVPDKYHACHVIAGLEEAATWLKNARSFINLTHF